MTETGYGLPLRCEGPCAQRYLVPGLVRGSWIRVAILSSYWMLKTPGRASIPCPNCGTKLTAMRKRRRRRRHA